METINEPIAHVEEKKMVRNRMNFIRIDAEEFRDHKQEVVDRIEQYLQQFSDKNQECCLLIDVLHRNELQELQKIVKRYTDLLKLLSKRELQVLKLALSDAHNNDIADALSISVETVKTHRKNILSKAGCATIQELKSFFYRAARIVDITI